MMKSLECLLIEMKLTDDQIKIFSYSNTFKAITLFGVLKLDFVKEGRGKFLVWAHPSRWRRSPYDVHVIHHGRFSKEAVKKRFEKILSSYDSHFKHKVIEAVFPK